MPKPKKKRRRCARCRKPAQLKRPGEGQRCMDCAWTARNYGGMD